MRRRFRLSYERKSGVLEDSRQLLSCYPWLESGVAMADQALLDMNGLKKRKEYIVSVLSKANLDDETQQEIIAMINVLGLVDVVPFSLDDKEKKIVAGHLDNYDNDLLAEFGTFVNWVGLEFNNDLVLAEDSYNFRTGKSLPNDVLRVYKLDLDRKYI